MQCLLGMTLTVVAASVLADDERFNITRFQVEGNTLLSAEEVQRLVAPMTGPGRVYGDVQKALEALDNAYRKEGYSAVQVYVPEQELTSGVVRIQVTENMIRQVTVTGNKYFSEKNIRASVPALEIGKTPNLRAISEAVQLSNDGAAKQINVALTSAEEDGKIDAEVKVTDYDPLRVFLTLDNTGAASTGNWRTGVAIQYANLFDRDQVGTLAYTTSPDSPHGVKVDIYSLGYRIPLYSIGDSLDFIYGKSSVNTPAGSPTLGGVLGFTGKGDVYGLRWNHFFAREGETSTKLVFGIDYKKINSRCSGVDGVEYPIAPPTPLIASCVPYTTMPLSVTYSGVTRSAGQNLDYNIGIARNWGTGNAYTNPQGGNRTDRYSYLTPGSRNTIDDFIVLRGGGSLFKGFANDWQMRVAVSAQYAFNPLVSAEQFGLVGATTVRGFTERAVAADSGVIVNTEAYTPELVSKGNLRLLGFYDIGRGYNKNVGSSGIPSGMTVASIGFGARYALGRDFNMKLDVARVAIAGTSLTEKRGDLNAHVSATLGF
jgi:hemolysin activation/secretion protein